ncbi:MAG: hypothetical protein KatS3mg014_2182 [Actinomycetota bacterium]|nr:MAG: hypothetical protein KatS3mg014_2182 [Actinomycetota bacterium]
MARIRGRRGLFLSLSVGLLFAAGIAFAAWTATGTGSGYAKATTAQPLTTVDVSATTPATLYPGATGDVLLRINNPNPYPVVVNDVTGNGAITASNPSCNVASVTFTDQTGLSLNVPASSAATFTLSGAVQMSTAANDDCQGATFTIPVALTGSSA